MTDFHPAVQMSPAEARVIMAPETPRITLTLEGVIDRTHLGDLTGVEVIDVRVRLQGAHMPDAGSSRYPRWSYDPEIDALYVHLAAGPGQVQQKRALRAGVDRDGQLVELRIPLNE